ncbi:DNA-directed RNA polymerases II 24 kDa polypeptide (RNA polymerase II subunit 5) [Ceratobasidium sp. UAMH 11750]|nr:DNA-directed RNA polymerases II 24 kDa polypeptide (RNA polymerase II subunit 5) [Ceratobasidium sp. UAMH 11750]
MSLVLYRRRPPPPKQFFPVGHHSHMASQPEASRELARLHRVNRTIHELVRDRGYLVSEEEVTLDIAAFKSNFGSGENIDRTRLNFFTNHKDDPTNQIFVFFADEKNVTIKTMRKFLGILDEKAITHGIIVFMEKMTPSARKVISAMSGQYSLEEFAESDLLINITHHKLVPQHEVLSPVEKKALLER